MRFNDNVDLDVSQISDRRGGRGAAVAGGGGIIGVIATLLYLFAGGDPAALTDSSYNQSVSGGQDVNLAAECQTGIDANNEEDCRIVGTVNSVQAYWSQEVRGYRSADTAFFDGGTNTACGAATTAVGPFYCPGDEMVYIDLAFYDELRSRFGATGGPFAEAYVIAHEYGHHVQNLTGILDRASDGSTGDDSNSVRVELQADCYAGMWAQNAIATGFLVELTPQDIADGLDAAAAVGDDRIQERAQGRVDPESWTHGSAEQRQRWFMAGYESTSTRDCDTFSARDV